MYSRDCRWAQGGLGQVNEESGWDLALRNRLQEKRWWEKVPGYGGAGISAGQTLEQ